jgi:stearoyl-CoA desaturase (delta-9 desaturase)
MAKTSEPNRSKTSDPKKQHISETPMTRGNWYKHINWLNVYLIIGVPIYGLVQAWWVPLYAKTAVFAFVYYFMTGMGITAGTYCKTSCSLVSIANTLQAITDCGLTLPIPLPFPYASFSPQSEGEPSKDLSAGGPGTIAHTTASQIPKKILTRFEKA